MRSCCLGLIAAVLMPAFASAAEPKRAAGTETIPATGFFVVSVNVAQLWDDKSLAGVRQGLLDAKHPLLKTLKKETGFDLADLERVTVSIPTFGFGPSESPIFLLTARKAVDLPKLLKAIQAVPIAEARKTVPNIPEEIDGTSVYVKGDSEVFIAIDERTIAFTGFRGLNRIGKQLSQFLADLKAGAPAQDGPLAEALALAPKHTVVVGVDFAPLRKALEGAGEVPEEYRPFAKMAQAERGLLTMDFGQSISAKAALTFFDAETAEKVEPAAKEIFDLARAILGQEAKDKRRDAETKAVVDPILAFLDAALGKATSKRAGKVLTLTAGGEVDAALKKSLDAFPAWVAVESERATIENNVKQIGLALHNYESAHGHFPQDITDKNGKAILSWRVQLLPYMEQEKLYKQFDMEQEKLYKQFDLTKPWDDAVNKGLIEKMPDVYKRLGREPKDKGFTYFQTFAAEKATEGGSPFLVAGVKRSPITITDGTSNTLMVVEAAEAVNWLKPGDLAYDPKKLPKVGHDGWMYAGFGDGRVRRMLIPKAEVLKALITVDGGDGELR